MTAWSFLAEDIVGTTAIQCRKSAIVAGRNLEESGTTLNLKEVSSQSSNRAWHSLLCSQHLQHAGEGCRVRANQNSIPFEEYDEFIYALETGIETQRAKKISLWPAREAVAIPHFATAAVFKWTNFAYEDVETGIIYLDSTTFAIFPPTGLAGDCTDHTTAVLFEKNAFENIARSKVQKLVWDEIYQNGEDGTEKVQSVR